ncbi:class I SAM-dependent methyltransferase [Bacteriovoracales bacterium]|nr:class I SAM-dependent methyltransferase [Bacteriovoracales bacterium]
MVAYTLIALFKKKESPLMKNQTNEFSGESCRYVSAYLDSPHVDFLENEKIFDDYKPKNILDVGCGNGKGLYSLTEKFNCSGVGVEPSDEAVKLLINKYKNKKNLNYISASAHHLPFVTDSFDLVTVWSVLHWVGRNEYLQALGELIRVTNKYLIVMDFVSSENYRTAYHHKPGFYTYKMDFEQLILGSGIMKKTYSKQWLDTNQINDKYVPISYKDLTPFLKNKNNYSSRKMVIFEKNYEALPVYSEKDFNP